MVQNEITELLRGFQAMAGDSVNQMLEDDRSVGSTARKQTFDLAEESPIKPPTPLALTFGPKTPQTTGGAGALKRRAAVPQEELQQRIAQEARVNTEGADAMKEFAASSSVAGEIFTPILADLNVDVGSVASALHSIAAATLDVPVSVDTFLDMTEEMFVQSAVLADASDVATREELLATIREIEFRTTLARRAVVKLKASMLLTHRINWLANHTPGANWETARQLLWRGRHDAAHMYADPDAVKLSTWPEKVANAMAIANEGRIVNKEGKSLGPVCPGLKRYQFSAGRGGRGGGRGGKGTGRGGQNGGNGGRGPYKPTGPPKGQGQGGGNKRARGKENRPAGAGALAGAAAAAAGGP
jgi:uncharacterized membrane protein YgcG